MVDRYTKTVLTVIAVALVGLLAVQLTPVAHAQGYDTGELQRIATNLANIANGVCVNRRICG